jgi:hypothetical protein
LTEFGLGGSVSSVALSPNSQQLITVNARGAAIWSTELVGSLERIERIARARVTRALTSAELRTYFQGVGG